MLFSSQQKSQASNNMAATTTFRSFFGPSGPLDTSARHGEQRDARSEAFPELGPSHATPSFASAAAEGARRAAAEEAPSPTHVTRQRTVLIDFKTAKRVHTRADRATFLLEDLKIPGDSVTALYMLQVEQLFLVTFSDEEVFKAAADRLRGGVPWSAAECLAGHPTTLFYKSASPTSTQTPQQTYFKT